MSETEGASKIGRSHVIGAVALLLVAFLPRVLTAGRAMWFDERFTLLNTASIRDALAYCTKDVHPPLYFVLVALWRTVLPSSEFSLRLLSLLFGMASIVGIFLAARAVGGLRAGVAAFLIAALSPYHWFYSTELRPYPMMLAFSAFSTWAFFAVLRSGRLRHFIVLTVASILNLYTHYFAVFLLAAQAVVLLAIALRSLVSGASAPALGRRQLLLGAAALGIVAVAYAPWASVFRRIVARSVFEGHAVGVGKRIGRGVTVDLVRDALYGSLGWGIVPFCLQAILVGWALLGRKLRDASLFFIVVWAVPLLMLIVWRPAHFIESKYFLFAYPATVAMAAGGLEAAGRLLAARATRSKIAFVVMVLAVSASPLLPGQHPRYVLNPVDWRDVIAETDQYLKEGDSIQIGDTKIYAMILQYADAGFFKRHPIVFSPQDSGEKGAEPSGHNNAWTLGSGVRSERLLSGMGKRLQHVKTWYIYPTSVSLYRWVPETAGPLDSVEGKPESP